MRRYYSYPYKAEPLHFPIEPIARRFTTIVIVLCIGLVFFNLGAHAILDPRRMAENELKELAKDYYENYYYDIFTQNLKDDNDYVLAFTTFSEYGFPKTYLRELLLFDEGRHESSRAYFDGQYYCNTNHTAIQIIPYAPFGRTDYEVKYTYECEWQ